MIPVIPNLYFDYKKNSVGQMYQEFGILMNICGALRDLVPFVQLKNVRNTKSRNALHLEDFDCNVSLTQYLSYKFC